MQEDIKASILVHPCISKSTLVDRIEILEEVVEKRQEFERQVHEFLDFNFSLDVKSRQQYASIELVDGSLNFNVKLGLSDWAHKLFVKMPKREMCSWTSMELHPEMMIIRKAIHWTNRFTFDPGGSKFLATILRCLYDKTFRSDKHETLSRYSMFGLNGLTGQPPKIDVVIRYFSGIDLTLKNDIRLSSLGGNARTIIICTMSAAQSHVEQSKNTILFASCATEVTTNVHENVVVFDKALVKKFQKELAGLESELKHSRPTSTTSDLVVKLQEKGLQIEKPEKNIVELTQQRDLVQTHVEDFRPEGEEDEPSIVLEDHQYPTLRVCCSQKIDNSVLEWPIDVNSRCLDDVLSLGSGGVRIGLAIRGTVVTRRMERHLNVTLFTNSESIEQLNDAIFLGYCEIEYWTWPTLLVQGYLDRTLICSMGEGKVQLHTYILNMFTRCGSIRSARWCFNQMIELLDKTERFTQACCANPVWNLQ